MISCARMAQPSRRNIASDPRSWITACNVFGRGSVHSASSAVFAAADTSDSVWLLLALSAEPQRTDPGQFGQPQLQLIGGNSSCMRGLRRRFLNGDSLRAASCLTESVIDVFATLAGFLPLLNFISEYAPRHE